ncbi:MAG: biotin synthase [Candidatus Nitrosocaldaceae archaeon]|nr:MAG: biotin synthase [Candidatus Nitrosocaldaceae archaeon]
MQLIEDCMNKVLNGRSISMKEALALANLDNKYIEELTNAANIICREFNGDKVDIESLINAKSGNCPEDCFFCAQSSRYSSNIKRYPLLDKEVIAEAAQKAKEAGANSFCIVCAYREPPEEDFNKICDTIKYIKDNVGIEVNCSLGFLTDKRAKRLKELGVKRYNHNLEACKSYFDRICTTHDYDDRVKTAKKAKENGLELCSGGIIGMGENLQQRLELAFEASILEPDEFPLNILIPREGTKLEGIETLDPLEAIKMVSIYRFIMPKTIIKLAGGREVHLGNLQSMALLGGANGIITGGYLTVGGNKPEEDIEMIRNLGLKV